MSPAPLARAAQGGLRPAAGAVVRLKPPAGAGVRLEPAADAGVCLEPAADAGVRLKPAAGVEVHLKPAAGAEVRLKAGYHTGGVLGLGYLDSRRTDHKSDPDLIVVRLAEMQLEGKLYREVHLNKGFLANPY